jgi:hypothetical protein
MSLSHGGVLFDKRHLDLNWSELVCDCEIGAGLDFKIKLFNLYGSFSGMEDEIFVILGDLKGAMLR